MISEALKTKYLPAETSLSDSGLKLTRLFMEADPAVSESFQSLAAGIIGGAYDEITDRFAKNLVEIDARGFDENGYFTIGKEIWVARIASTDEVIGFEVITRKRGGSIKLGPTLLLPQFRGRHFARDIINLLLDSYAKAGARKVYVTAPLSHEAANALDFHSLGLSVEGILRSQYRSQSSERVFGRLLRPLALYTIEANVWVRPESSEGITVKRGIQALAPAEFISWIMEKMAAGYGDIDESFGESILKAADRGFEAAYEEKGKLIYTIWANDSRWVGCVICTPKRGGAVKVAPILLAPEYHTRTTVEAIMKTIRDDMATFGRRKILSLIPVLDWSIAIILFDMGYTLEGILRSPYKEANDIIVLSDHLK